MVLEWGMSDGLGPVVAERPREQIYLGEGPPRWREYSEATAHRVDEAVEQIITSCYQRALSTLEERRAALDRVAARLGEAEELGGEEVIELIGDTREHPPSEGEQRATEALTGRTRSAGT
jgi:cell division protease FtsH